MKWYLPTLLALLVPLAYGYAPNQKYPTFGKCDQKIISFIKGYWLVNFLSRPRNVLRQIEEKKNYTILHTSYDYYNSDNKCIYMNATHGNIDFNFVPKTGDTVSKTSWTATEGDDGIIRGKAVGNDAPEHSWNWYTVYSKDGVLVCYICSDAEGSPELPLLDVIVESDKNRSGALSSIRTFTNLIKGWGVNLKYNYETEC